eukprot:6463682-Amphidinium_carterae.1
MRRTWYTLTVLMCVTGRALAVVANDPKMPSATFNSCRYAGMHATYLNTRQLYEALRASLPRNPPKQL